MIKLRELATGARAVYFILTMIVGFCSVFLALFILPKVVSIVDVLNDDNQMLLKSEFAFFMLFNAFVVMPVMWGVLKFVKSNNPYLLSSLVGIVSLLIWIVTVESYFLNFNYEESVVQFIAISVMVFTWIIMAQTSTNLIKSLSLGVLAYTTIYLIRDIIYSIIIYQWIITLLYLVTSFVAIIVVPKVFEFTLNMFLKLTGIKLENNGA